MKIIPRRDLVRGATHVIIPLCSGYRGAKQ
jgi:hypothetical protein